MSDSFSNFFGRIYPTYDHAKLVEAFAILPSETVLDIGGGHNPFSRAYHIVDFDLSEGDHRDGQNIPDTVKDRYIKADVHCLPFEDKSIDFIYCSHVLEHVKDPETACRELMRVGKRGFIETPRKWTEFFAGYPSHQWLIDVINEELVFERRQFIESPYMNALLHAVWRSKKLEVNALRRFLYISCVQFSWNDRFPFRVVDSGADAFDYANPAHAALSHYYFAKFIFVLGAPLEHGIFHARKAAAIAPDDDRFSLLLAGYALELEDAPAWRKVRGVVQRHGILSAADVLLLKCGYRSSSAEKLRAWFEQND